MGDSTIQRLERELERLRKEAALYFTDYPLNDALRYSQVVRYRIKVLEETLEALRKTTP